MFLKGLQLYDKETPAQVFSCEICEIVKNIFNYRTPLVTASIITEKKSKFCLEWHWINVLRRSKNTGFSAHWNKRNLNISMLSNSKSKGWSLKDVYLEYTKYILGNGSLYWHKKLVFSEMTLAYYHFCHCIHKCIVVSVYHIMHFYWLLNFFFLDVIWFKLVLRKQL